MGNVVSLRSRMVRIGESLFLRIYRNGSSDFVSLYHQDELGISLWVNMEIGQDGLITTRLYTDGPAVTGVEQSEIASVPRVPL